MGTGPGGGSDAVEGLVVVDKPAGWTSHDVVARLRRIYGLRRVGHAGTLDPDATGVLLVGLGRATRLLRFLTETGKVYRGEVAFGVATDTLDAAGTETARAPMPALSRAGLDAVLPRFLGTIAQIPPMVSAVKVEGRRLHERARAGEVVERAPRTVRIDRIEVEAFTPGEFPLAQLLVECGSGTYIRSLAADLGEALGGCAHLAWLRRLRVGPFPVEEARTLEEIEASPDKVLLPMVEAVRHLARLDVDGETARGVAHGAVFPVTALPGPGDEPGPFAVVGPDGRLLALYEKGRAAARPLVVLAGGG
ncbi:MAG TPA: tRNA pseudouridine(55) synthase TruB [Acidimicrobiia bacterium]|nr:tRNA pseudouridine(55) synthase TruB [Acidimicrobiia bacterium]HKN89139.1 tRNA pseudouridine(55) synthase TruB [Acidimicrobiia bacterium]